MATTKEMLDEAELAKGYITNSALAEDQKLTYFRLINITMEATNGISPEQKIQKMTEAILLLAASQAKYIIGLDDRINAAVQRANKAQCKECRAMKHVDELDEQKRHQEMIENWKRANGITTQHVQQHAQQQAGTVPWTEIAKQILLKPYVYVFLTLATISPYGAQIIDKILAFCAK